MPPERFKPYTTADLTQAAFMKAHDVELLASRRVEGRTFFIFRGGHGTEKVASQYFANEFVRIGDFRRAWHDLKDIIFSPSDSAEGKGDSSED